MSKLNNIKKYKEYLITVSLAAIILSQTGYPSGPEEEMKYPVYYNEGNHKQLYDEFSNSLKGVAKGAAGVVTGLGMCVYGLSYSAWSESENQIRNTWLKVGTVLAFGGLTQGVYSVVNGHRRMNNLSERPMALEKWIVGINDRSAGAAIQHKQGKEEECPICMSDVGEDTIFVEAPTCGHNYCLTCYEFHVLGSDPSSSTAKCDYCRQTFSKTTPIVAFRPQGPEVSLSRTKPQEDGGIGSEASSENLHQRSGSARQ